MNKEIIGFERTWMGIWESVEGEMIKKYNKLLKTFYN